MHQLQAIIKQSRNMINAPNQNHDKLQCVYNHSTKFQVHPIHIKNFTKHLKSWLTKSPHLVKQKGNSQTNWKCIQKIPEKFSSELNIPKHHHAKIQHISSSYDMANKIRKLGKTWCDTNCHTSKDHNISHNPETQKSQTTYQNSP